MININFQQQKRSSPYHRTPGLLPVLVLLLTQGACVAQSEPEPETKAKQPPEATEQSIAVTGEVPLGLLDNIISDLGTKENYDRDTISIIRAESVIWRDGSLGCPKPGEMYTQAQVQGYWVVLQSAGKEFDYRASSTGYFFRCTNTFKVRPPIG